MHQLGSHWTRFNIVFTILTNNTDLLRCKTQIYKSRHWLTHRQYISPTHIASTAPGQFELVMKMCSMLLFLVIQIIATSGNKIGANK